MATNDFVPFCPTNTGSNLLSQSDYLTSPDLPIGNQPGVASSKLNNKALRQATYIASCVAQFISNVTGDNVLDDATQSEVLATMSAAFSSATQITSVTANYAALQTDDIILCSGSAFTVTLPSASTNTNKKYTIIKTDASFSNVITISGITGMLATQNENFVVFSNGTSWVVLSHRSGSDWTSFTPTITALGTVSNLSAYWRRVGDSIQVRGLFQAGIVTGTTALFGIPTGLSIDSSKVSGTGSIGAVVGTVNVDTAAGAEYSSIYNGTSSGVGFSVNGAGSGGLFSYTGNQFNNNENFSVFFEVPIVNWSS